MPYLSHLSIRTLIEPKHDMYNGQWTKDMDMDMDMDMDIIIFFTIAVGASFRSQKISKKNQQCPDTKKTAKKQTGVE
jgi:hypothetical protein